MSKLLLLFAACLFSQVYLYSQTCELANAGPDQTICPFAPTVVGTPAILGYSYYWSPPSAVNNPYIAQPTATISNNATLTLTIQSLNNNLVQNGDFELGLTGFNTDYGTYPNGIGCSGNPFGSLAVVTNPLADLGGYYCNRYARPSHGNQMLFVDGTCQVGRRVWYQTVSVTPGNIYNFSAWASNGSEQFGFNVNYAASLRVRINGVNIVQNIKPWTCSQWFELFASWNSGSANTAIIEIYDDYLAESYNDFCLDDIVFTDCRSTDQVNLTTGQVAPTISPSGPITYYNQFETRQNLKLTSSPASNYQWYKNGVAIQGANSQIYSLSFDGYQSYTNYYTVRTLCGRIALTSNSVQFNYHGCMYDYEYPAPIIPGYLCQSTITPPNFFQLYPASTNSGMSTIWWLSADQLGGTSQYSISNSGQLTQISNLGMTGYGTTDAIYTKSFLGGEQIYMHYVFGSSPWCRTSNSNLQTSIYPNPTISNSEVTINSTEDILKVELIDPFKGVTIRQIKGSKSRSLRMSVIGLKEGVYTCRVTTLKQVENIKLIIKR